MINICYTTAYTTPPFFIISPFTLCKIVPMARVDVPRLYVRPVVSVSSINEKITATHFRDTPNLFAPENDEACASFHRQY